MENVFRIALDPILDLASISALQASCKEALLCNAPSVCIDASNVERLKTPIFQLLLSLQKSLQAKQLTLVIEKPSDAFKDLSSCLGILSAFTYSEAA